MPSEEVELGRAAREGGEGIRPRPLPAGGVEGEIRPARLAVRVAAGVAERAGLPRFPLASLVGSR